MDGLIVVIFDPDFWILNRPSDDLIWKSRDTETSRKPQKTYDFLFFW